MRITYSATRIIGARTEQQDEYDLKRFKMPSDANKDEYSYMFVLADGMGGHTGGRQASKAAVSAFVEAMEAACKFDNTTLRACLDIANRKLYEIIQRDPTLRGMGTTFIGAVVRYNQLNWISIGDSLLLLFTGSTLRRINEDHSMAPRLDHMVKMGEISEEQARRDPRRNALLDALRGQDIKYIDDRCKPLPLQPGDRLLIASDGIEVLSSKTIYKVLSSHRDDDAALKELFERIKHVNDQHQDNTTCIIVSMHEDTA